MLHSSHPDSVLCDHSSSRIFFASNTIVQGRVYSEGNGFSHFAWPQVSEHLYIGNTTNVGNPAAWRRQETMSFDGGECVYDGQVNDSIASNSNEIVRGPCAFWSVWMC